ETIYNRGVLEWRRGELQYEELVQKLLSARAVSGDSWQAKYLLGLVHLEWGEADRAAALLEEAAREVPTEKEVLAYLRLARSGNNNRGRCLQTFTGHTQAVTSLFLSSDRRILLSGSDDRSLHLWDATTGSCLRAFGKSSEGRILLWMG